MKRNGVPIGQHGFKKVSKSANITSRNGSTGLFNQFRAAIHCGATLDELFKLRNGDYPKEFVAELIMFHELDLLVDAHIADANYVKPKKGRG